MNEDSGNGDVKSIGFSLAYMDRSADPQSDFYRYAAGSWLKTNPVPPEKSRWGAFNELHDRNLLLMKAILDEAGDGSSYQSGSRMQLIGGLYSSAMDTARIEELKFDPIAPLLDRIKEVQAGRDLIRLVADFDSAGIDTFFNSYSDSDKLNSGIYSYYLDQGGLSLPEKEYYLSDDFSELRSEYIGHMERMFGLAGVPDGECRRMAETVLRIETELARASRSSTELRDEEKNYNRMEVSSLDTRFPSLLLPLFLLDSHLPKTDYIVVGQPEFFERLDRLLSSESIADIRSFLRWKVLHSFAPCLHSEVDREHFDFFHRKLLGQEKPEARWKRMTQLVDSLLGEALGAVYVERHFPPEAKKRALMMIDDIREVFMERLAGITWMTEQTRRRALEKFSRFKVKVGYPEKFRDYSSIRIDPSDLVGNIIRCSRFESQRHALRVGSPVDREEWLMTPPTVNAYFHPMENTINFPAGILQPPYFDMDMDDAVNYGAIGMIIGHEITHGYDDQGRKFDADGNLHDWWTSEDEAGFQSRARAVVELYSAQEPLPGLHVNGELTLGENIADFGGLSIAYEALQKRLAKEPAGIGEVDGMTPWQRFFISYCQMWRSNSTEQEIRRLLTIDSHAPSRYRATLPAVNHPGFDSAFPPRGGIAGKAQGIAVW